MMSYNWYDEDEIYKTRPWWWDNLQKAHESIRRKSNIKKNQESQEFFDRFGGQEQMLKDPQPYLDWLEERRDGIRPVGRPKMLAEDKKAKKMKRSDEMKKLLVDNGIAVDEGGNLVGFGGWKFMANGRLKHKDEPTVSVHSFLQDL
jgi:hypothetical protein